MAWRNLSINPKQKNSRHFGIFARKLINHSKKVASKRKDVSEEWCYPKLNGKYYGYFILP